MRKFLALLILAAFPAFGQVVDSTQLALKTNGGLTGNAANELTALAYRAVSAPASPISGQFWCDTTFTPCILKVYTGTAWNAVQSTSVLPIIADLTTYPGSPVDGQIVFSKNPYGIFIYDNTATTWVSAVMRMQTTASSYTDTYTNAVIAAPTAATATASGTAGSLSAGNYSYKVTCVNSTGGETTGGTVSNSITSLVSKSTDLSAIPTCGTGGLYRRIYRSKVNQDRIGPWYYVTIISDNSTTTLNDGLADASLVYYAPDVNFSGAMTGIWTVRDTTASQRGGCGTTSRGTMACMSHAAFQFASTVVGGPTADPRLSASVNLLNYSSSITIQFRIRWLGTAGDYGGPSMGPCPWGLRATLNDNYPRIYWCGAGQATQRTSAFNASTHWVNGYTQRLTINAAGSNTQGSTNPWPAVSGYPIYVRVVKRGNLFNSYLSVNNYDWSILQINAACTTSTDWSSACAVDMSGADQRLGTFSHFEIPVGYYGNPAITAAWGGQQWVEWDQFQILVQPQFDTLR